jgi:hypothetical protein
MALTKVSGTGLKDDCITSAHMSAVITNADIASNAAIAGTKINPDFGSQTIATSGVTNLTGELRANANVKITNAGPKISLVDSNNDDDFEIKNNDGVFTIRDATNSVDRFTINSQGNISAGGTITSTFSGSGASLTSLAANQLSSGTVPTARLGSGTASSSTYLRGDNSWATVTSVGGATGVSFDDDVKASWGDQDDLDIWHNGTDSYITSDTGGLVLTAQTFIRLRPNGGVDGIAVWNNGAVQLSHANQLKLATTSTGVTVTGTATATTFSGSGASLTSLPAAQLSGAIANGVTATTQSASDNSTKVATTAYTDTAISNLVDSSPSALNTLNELAAALGDDANFSTTVTNSIATKLPLAGGTLTGNVKLNDSIKTIFGSDDDAYMMHNGSHQYNRCSTGYYHIQAQELRVNKADGNQYLLRAVAGGTVELYHNGSKKLETTSYGGHLTGEWRIEGGDLFLDDDSYKLKIGEHSDITMYHDNGHGYLDNITGKLTINGNNGNGSQRKAIVINPAAGTEIYYDNDKKFETTAGGTIITGTLDTTGTIASGGHIKTGTDTGKFFAGAANDLQIYHDGTHSYVTNNTGDLFVGAPSGKAVYLRPNNGANGVICHPSAGIELFFNNSSQCQTFDGGLNFQDNKKAEFGGSGDLKIYHDGNNNLILGSPTVLIKNKDNNESYIRCNENAAVELYYDNSLRLSTASDGVHFTNGHLRGGDNNYVILGAGQDLHLYHDGTHSKLVNSTGDLHLASNNAVKILGGSDLSEVQAVFNDNGAVELYYNNSKKLETISEGAKVHGHLRFDDSKYIKLGTSADVQMFHNGANFHIQHLTSGSTYIDSVGSHHFRNSAGTEYRAKFVNNGAVELYYDNSKKFETTTNGVQVIGDISFYNNSTAGRDILWDVSDNALKVDDNTNINFGNGNDLQLFHNGTNSHIENSTNTFYIRSDLLSFQSKTSSEEFISCTKDGAVKLHYDNSKKFETTSSGIDVTGAITVNGSALSSGLFTSIARYHDETNSSSGTFSNGAWRTRTLNTEDFDPDGIGSLSSNQITLGAGTYYVQWRAPAYRVQRHVTRLWNVTDGSQIGRHGQAGYSPQQGDPANGYSHGAAWFTISSSKAIRIEDKCSHSRGTNGFGVSGGTTPHVFTAIEIFKAS